MGVTTLAERIGESKEEAQNIIDEFYKGFTGVKKFTEDSQAMLKKKGYITDAFGRRRHIPDGMLPEYDIKVIGGDNFDFNPLIDSEPHEDVKTKALISSYREKLSVAKWKKDKDAIIEQAKKDGLEIHNNGGFINRALRQCLNARIQGTSASMTKMAMVMIDNDKELNDLGFKLLITVHDEVFGECPTENSEKAAKRLCEVMVEAAKIKCGKVPWKCDPYILKRWYSDEASGEILKDYKKLIKNGSSDTEALISIKEKYSMIKPKYIDMMCKDEYDPNLYEDI